MPPRPRTYTPLKTLNYCHHHHHNNFIYNYNCNYTSKNAFSSSSSTLHASPREPTYYEILNVPVTATTSEIKKHFYSLSLRHHPDRNPNDPTATARFSQISSAYHILSNEAKRRSYDRDHGILNTPTTTSTHSTANPGQHPMGSYSSYSANLHNKQGATYAGSRPASGLSKRRGPFRGPPPSFYRHGGYGRSGRGHFQAGMGQTGGAAGGAAGAAANEGPGGGDEEDPTAFIDRNSLHHFNARSHFRTQAAEDVRRQRRRSKEMGADLNEHIMRGRGDFIMRFIVVCGILVAAGSLTGFFRWPDEKSRSSRLSARKRED